MGQFLWQFPGKTNFVHGKTRKLNLQKEFYLIFKIKKFANIFVDFQKKNRECKKNMAISFFFHLKFSGGNPD